MTRPKAVYLDVCALCRPFDDQMQIRSRLETDAVQLILSHVRARRLTLLVSPAHIVEINAIDDRAEQEQLLALLRRLGQPFTFDRSAARQRARQLAQLGLGPADAAHLALAEQAQADFVTCDDRLLRQCQRIQPAVWCGSPLLFCEKEQLE